MIGNEHKEKVCAYSCGRDYTKKKERCDERKEGDIRRSCREESLESKLEYCKKDCLRREEEYKRAEHVYKCDRDYTKRKELCDELKKKGDIHYYCSEEFLKSKLESYERRYDRNDTLEETPDYANDYALI